MILSGWSAGSSLAQLTIEFLCIVVEIPFTEGKGIETVEEREMSSIRISIALVADGDWSSMQNLEL